MGSQGNQQSEAELVLDLSHGHLQVLAELLK
jgi:hypothetical protein